MKRSYLYICLLFSLMVKAQNLVPNPGFESYTLCPANSCKIEDYALEWNAATANGSTDYYNVCSANCNLTNQVAHSGNGYAGLFFFQSPFTNLREYLQVKLISPLVQNTTYHVEFFVSLHDGNYFSPCNNIAANFSVTRPFTANFGFLQPLNPHIRILGNPIVNDSINWIQVSGCYTALGGEEYLTIGNFKDDMNTQTTNTATAAYYFVDDVKVEEITGSCVTGINELNSNYQVQVYPNPTNGTFSIAYTLHHAGHTFELYDLMGRRVSEKLLDGTEGVESIDLNNINSGIYFYNVMDADDKLLFNGKLIVSN